MVGLCLKLKLWPSHVYPGGSSLVLGKHPRHPQFRQAQ